MSDAQSGKTNITLNVVQILDLGCGVLQKLFFKQKEDRAKACFKDLKRGQQLALGDLTLTGKPGTEQAGQSTRVPLYLDLDYSEFVGPGFSFPTFRTAAQALLERIATTMRARKDLNLLTNQQTGGALIHQPGVIRIGEQINVLLLAIEPKAGGGVVLRLMFVDPEQYRRNDDESSAS